MAEQKDLRLAVLIDADNAPRSAIGDVMAEVAVYGTPTIKRIYGDWTTPNLASWKPLLLENAITPVQQYGYTTGKNSTDSAMIIDAMDLMYTRRFDGFCLVFIHARQDTGEIVRDFGTHLGNEFDSFRSDAHHNLTAIFGSVNTLDIRQFFKPIDQAGSGSGRVAHLLRDI